MRPLGSSLTLVLLIACAAACGSDNSEPAAPAPSVTPPPDPAEAAARDELDDPPNTVPSLDDLARFELGDARPACASYEAAVAPWFRELDAATRELSAALAPDAPGPMRTVAGVLERGAETLAAIETDDEDLTRIHAELAAAVKDLARGFSAWADATDGAELRVHNAVDNLRSVRDRLVALCGG